jgi:hypothetical protein
VNVLPIYLVLEESEAMKGARLDAVNSALPHIHYAVARDPIVNDKVRFGVISFSDTAEVLVPLTQLAQLQHLPGLVPKGGINYTAAFTLVKTCIQTDVDALRAQNFEVQRPLIFLVVSNEKPADDWRDAHRELICAPPGDTTWRSPLMVVFGFDVVDPENTLSLASARQVGGINRRWAYAADSSNAPEFEALIAEVVSRLPYLFSSPIVSKPTLPN